MENHNISATTWPISMKFGTVMHLRPTFTWKVAI